MKDIEICAEKYILIELGELIVFSTDLSEGVGEMGFIFCCWHPPLATITQVSDPGPIGPLLLFML